MLYLKTFYSFKEGPSVRNKTLKVGVALVLFGYGFLFVPSVQAASSDVVQVESFIRGVIKAIAGLSSLIATGFFVVGGLKYITSSGNPIRLERAKHTLIYSGIGLAVVIGAFVVSNIVTDLATSAFGK